MSIKASAPDTWRDRVTTAADAAALIGLGERVLSAPVVPLRSVCWPRSSAAVHGRADHVPVPLAEVPAMMRDGRFPIDVALVQVAPPDVEGMCSLGPSIDVTREAVQPADRVIAEVNPVLPRSRGESRVPLSRLDQLVEVSPRVTEYVHEPIGDVGRQIARYVARFIPHGATLQIGLGLTGPEHAADLA